MPKYASYMSMITTWLVVRIMIRTDREFHCHSRLVDRIFRITRVCGRVRANDYANISDRVVTSPHDRSTCIAERRATWGHEGGMENSLRSRLWLSPCLLRLSLLLCLPSFFPSAALLVAARQ